MEKKLNELHKTYDAIEVPDSIDAVIDAAIERKKKNNTTTDIARRGKIMSQSKTMKRVGAAAAALIVGMGITVNVSPVMAQELSELPIIGAVARLMTIREYSIENDTSIGEVKVPNVEISNKEIEKRINGIIDGKIKSMEEEQAKLDAEYKEAFLETGGKEEDFNKIEMSIDYKLNYSTDKLISFMVSKYQTLAPAYSETVYYNIDIETGDSFDLEKLLGDDYASIVKTKTLEAMKQRVESGEEIEFDTEYLKNDIEINKDRKFYINDKKEVVVVFDKYEVAAGVFGPQEFVVGNMK